MSSRHKEVRANNQTNANGLGIYIKPDGRTKGYETGRQRERGREITLSAEIHLHPLICPSFPPPLSLRPASVYLPAINAAMRQGTLTTEKKSVANAKSSYDAAKAAKIDRETEVIYYSCFRTLTIYCICTFLCWAPAPPLTSYF